MKTNASKKANSQRASYNLGYWFWSKLNSVLDWKNVEIEILSHGLKTKDLGVVRNVAFSKILIKVRKFVIQDPLGETYNYQVD